MKNILNTPEVQALISALLTAVAAWIKRRFDLKAIRKRHEIDLADLTDKYEAQLKGLQKKV